MKKGFGRMEISFWAVLLYHFIVGGLWFIGGVLWAESGIRSAGLVYLPDDPTDETDLEVE